MALPPSARAVLAAALLAALATGASSSHSPLAHGTTGTGASHSATTANNASTLDIWVLPHAHCDTGWLYTVEGCVKHLLLLSRFVSQDRSAGYLLVQSMGRVFFVAAASPVALLSCVAVGTGNTRCKTF
jgi:hypothetical protein